MAILQSNRERQLRLTELNPCLTCELCDGYLIKPTTITECLHTFCRSCIVKYLQDSEDNTCPHCHILIHETNPFEMLRVDQTMEDVIFRLVPSLQENEMRRERAFYMNIASREKESDSSNSLDHSGAADEFSCKESLSSVGSDGNFHRDEPQIGVCLEYLREEHVEQRGRVGELLRKYIRCSARITIGHIKKYLKLKLRLGASDQVEVMCNGEIMGKDHTLEFVFMTRWRVKDEAILTLQYRPKLDFL